MRPKRLSGDKRTFVFAANQRWVKAPKSINFVDETREIIGIHEVENQEPEPDHAIYAYSADTGVRSSASCQPINEGGSIPASVAASYLDCSTTSEELVTTRAKSAGRQKLSSNSNTSRKRRALRSASITNPTTVSSTGETTDLPAQSSAALQTSAAVLTPSLDDLGSFSLHKILDESTLLTSPSYESVFVDSPAAQSSSFSTEKSQSLSNVSIIQPRWPLHDSQEASLFRYFIRELAPLFDLCDNLRHFAKVVPKRAAFCPPLLNAILAAAAKRLSRIGDLDTVTGDKYYEECLKTLIPSLSSESAVKDENLLAATVILRFMEETDVPFSITGSQSHLIGIRVFLSAQEDSGEFSGLRLASFWVALRQEIFMAFIHSRPVHASLLTKNVAPILEGASDECSYANKIILHCAYCLQYCFGGQEQSLSVWTELSNYLDRWHENRPWCFQSMSPEDVGTSGFLPEITYLSDEVLTGMQHYYLGRLVLEAHSPETPRLGPGRNLAVDIVNQKLRRIVRIICGISEVRTLLNGKSRVCNTNENSPTQKLLLDTCKLYFLMFWVTC